MLLHSDYLLFRIHILFSIHLLFRLYIYLPVIFVYIVFYITIYGNSKVVVLNKLRMLPVISTTFIILDKFLKSPCNNLSRN